jgi:D-tyrosyl-tRNA(Tyr) deacylase
MRLVIQRVTSAQVSVAEKGIIASIGKGLCVLVGIGHGDGDKEIEWALDNIMSTKFWPDATTGSQWKTSLNSSALELLIVSQFTLYGKIYKKGRLDFHHAMPPSEARELYQKLVDSCSTMLGDSGRTQSGEFGAYMEVRIFI